MYASTCPDEKDMPEQCFSLDQQVLTTSGYSVAGMQRQGEGGAIVPTLTHSDMRKVGKLPLTTFVRL